MMKNLSFWALLATALLIGVLADQVEFDDGQNDGDVQDNGDAYQVNPRFDRAAGDDASPSKKGGLGDLFKGWKIRDPEKERGDDNKTHKGKDIVDKINNLGGKRKFKGKTYDRFEGKSLKHLRNFLGVAGDPKTEKEERLNKQNRTKRQTYPYPPNFSAYTYPASYDVSWKWPQCNPVMTQIQDQGQCGSCWAVSSAQVITDRRCIYFNATTLMRTSAWDLTSCCTSCSSGNGCNGGSPYSAFQWYTTTGVVSGGDNPSIGYSTAYCKPYPLKPTDPSPSSTPCSATCQSGYTLRTYSVDKRKGSNYFRIDYSDNAVMYELINRGPVVGIFAVYEDFYDYESGVYEQTYGDFVGNHAVKIVGWGVDAATGDKYWKAANSWGTSWGEGGYFRIMRDTNECNLEYYDAYAGIVVN